MHYMEVYSDENGYTKVRILKAGVKIDSYSTFRGHTQSSKLHDEVSKHEKLRPNPISYQNTNPFFCTLRSLCHSKLPFQVLLFISRNSRIISIIVVTQSLLYSFVPKCVQLTCTPPQGLPSRKRRCSGRSIHQKFSPLW